MKKADVDDIVLMLEALRCAVLGSTAGASGLKSAVSIARRSGRLSIKVLDKRGLSDD